MKRRFTILNIAMYFLARKLRKLDTGLLTYSNLKQLIKNRQMGFDLDLLLTLPEEHATRLLKLLKTSESQLRQDIFVLSELNFKRDGFFVEFGAADGVKLSNTYLLEKVFDWKGILAEPAKCWEAQLRKNRKAYVETSCVYHKSGRTVVFNETDIAELSTINTFSSSDGHHQHRQKGRTYRVNTISLIDLLKKYDAPDVIDYLSIDTEGSEYDVLRVFDFKKYTFRVITCEHNYSPVRNKIYELLTPHGYVRKFPGLSKFDDWYFKT